MTDLLLAEHGDMLGEDDQLLLARIIIVCVAKANGQQICPKTRQDPDVHDSKVFFSVNCHLTKLANNSKK